jgi:hypothetical protein
MIDQLIASKIQLLKSENLKKELLFFLDYLLAKQYSDVKAVKRTPKFGCAKGTFKMADDFDAPLEDLNA